MSSDKQGNIYAGYDTSRPEGLEFENNVEFFRREDMPQDYAWRALGDHIAAGPSDVPQTIQARVFVHGRWIGVQAQLTYVALDAVTGEPKDGK